MNELTELRDFGRDLDQEIPEPSAALRHRVLSAFTQSPWRPPKLRTIRFRITRRLAITGGLAVVLAAGLLIAPTLRLWNGASTTGDAQAAQILDRAALAARHQPVLTPRPSQFVFIKELVEFASESGSQSAPRYRLYPQLTETWSSVSGRRNGLARVQPRSHPLPGHPTGPWRTSHTPSDRNFPAYLAGLPTSAHAMLGYLFRHSEGQNPPAQQAFITAGDLIRDRYIRPAALAAVFEAVARIPGVVVVHGAVTISGTRGIAVQRIFLGQSYQLIFNPRTYAFIGERQVVAASPHQQVKAGTVMYSTTILRVAIVDHVGQLP